MQCCQLVSASPSRQQRYQEIAHIHPSALHSAGLHSCSPKQYRQPPTWDSMNLASASRAFSPPLSHSTCGLWRWKQQKQSVQSRKGTLPRWLASHPCCQSAAAAA